MTVTITKEENEKALECVLRSRGFSKRLITRLKRTENGMTRKGVLIRTVDLVYENDIIMINEGDGESLDPNPDLNMFVSLLLFPCCGYNLFLFSAVCQVPES